MKDILNNLYNKLHELEKLYALSLDELDHYLEIKEEIKRVKKLIELENK